MPQSTHVSIKNPVLLLGVGMLRCCIPDKQGTYHSSFLSASGLFYWDYIFKWYIPKHMVSPVTHTWILILNSNHVSETVFLIQPLNITHLCSQMDSYSTYLIPINSIIQQCEQYLMMWLILQEHTPENHLSHLWLSYDFIIWALGCIISQESTGN
jgi:hypothetical protein